MKLDASHQCILEKWETLSDMIACRDQVEKYLKEFTRKVCGALHSEHKANFRAYEMIDKYGEFALHPVHLLGWRKSDSPLLGLGIEYIFVENLLHLGSDSPCWSYVYSPYRHDVANDTTTDQLDSVVAPPSGFDRSFDSPSRGYVFTRKLPALTAEDFCNPAKLKQHFAEPLLTLVEWYNASEKTILKAFGSNRTGKTPN